MSWKNACDSLAACSTARPLGPKVAESPKFTKSTQQGTRSRCRIKPKRPPLHGLPTLSAPAAGCSGRFPCPETCKHERISSPSEKIRHLKTIAWNYVHYESENCKAATVRVVFECGRALSRARGVATDCHIALIKAGSMIAICGRISHRFVKNQ